MWQLHGTSGRSKAAASEASAVFHAGLHLCVWFHSSTAAISSPCWESPAVYSTLFRDVQSCPLIPNMILLSSIVYFPNCSHGSVFFCERGNWRPNDHYMIIQCGVLDLPLIGLWAIRIDSERGQRKALATLALHASALWGNKKSSCVDGGCFFLYMLETRTWIDVSCLWTWLCFQTCTPKTKVEVRLQRFWLMKVVRLVQCNFKHAHLISIAMPEITICAMHTDCKPRPSRSPSFKLHGLAMESRISGSSHFYVRSSISIFFNPHLNLACSVALAVWNNCVLINIQCKSKCNSLRPLDMICHVCWTIESCLVIHLLTGYNRFKGYQSPRHQCFYSTSTSQSQPAFAVWTFPTSCSDVLSTKVGKRHMQHTHAYARKYMCFPAESFVTWCRPTIACHELR